MLSAELDVGFQRIVNGNPIVVYPLNTLKEEEVLQGFKEDTSRFSMFGALGQGYGGFTLQGKEDPLELLDFGTCRFLNCKVYPAGWVRQLKALGLPPQLLPDGYTERQLAKLKPKISGMLIALEQWKCIKMGGFRMEMRLQPNNCNWQRLETQILELFSVWLPT